MKDIVYCMGSLFVYTPYNTKELPHEIFVKNISHTQHNQS